MEKKNNKMHYAFVIVASLFLQGFLAITIIGTAGLFVIPVTESLGISTVAYTMHMTIQYGVMAVAASFAPKVLGKYGFLNVNRASIALMAIAILTMAFAPNIFIIYVGAALLGISMVSVTYLAVGTLIPRWFKVRVGVMIATAGLGGKVSSVLMSPIFSKMLSMDSVIGLEPWRGIYVILAISLLTVGLLNAIFIMKEEPGEEGRYGEELEVVNQTTNNVVVGVDKDVALKSSSFKWLILMIICLNLAAQIQVYVASYAATSVAATTAGFDLKGLSVSLLMIGSVVGSYLVGGINDKFGAGIGSLVGGVVGAIGCLVMMLGATNGVVLLAGSFLFGIFYACGSIHLPSVVASAFGDREYRKIFPVASTIGPWIGAVSSSLWGLVVDMTGTYSSVMTIGIVICILTGVTGLIAVSLGKKLERN